MKQICLLTCFILSSAFTCSFAATNRKFPADFKWGVATASYQIEGAWNESGKSPNIWDHICHTNPSYIANEDNGDVACDSYHKWKEDVQLIKNLGVKFYRFSLSWTRILPLGFAGTKVNQAGVDYYKNLIEELIANGIEPMVTLYHWDLPQSLQDIGGWPNRALEFHFSYFAFVAFKEFGSLVKTWSTFNEPKSICQSGYGLGTMAPGIASAGLAEYQCAHTLLKSHAAAYHLYDIAFRPLQKGRIGIVIDMVWVEPKTESEEDIAASNRLMNFLYGWYAHPVVYGNYPQIMIDRVANRSQQEGYAESRLPTFSLAEQKLLKGSYDYIGLNHYTTVLGFNIGELPIGEPSFLADVGAYASVDPSWESSGSSWLKVVPWGFRKLVKYIWDNYEKPEIIVTENGVSDNGGLQDDLRIRYYREYLSSLLEAIFDDGVKVTGYTAWSLMDNFEWAQGYQEKFGLYRVNFSDPDRTRTAKDSVEYYKKVVSTGCLVNECEN